VHAGHVDRDASALGADGEPGASAATITANWPVGSISIRLRLGSVASTRVPSLPPWTGRSLDARQPTGAPAPPVPSPLDRLLPSAHAAMPASAIAIRIACMARRQSQPT